MKTLKRFITTPKKKDLKLVLKDFFIEKKN